MSDEHIARKTECTRTTLLLDEATVALRIFVIGGTVLAVIWLFLQVKIVTVAAFIGFAQAALLWPLVRLLARKIPKALAVLVATVAYIGLIAALLWFTLSQLGQAWPQLIDSVAGGVEQLAAWAAHLGIDVTSGLADQIRQHAGQLVSSLGGMALTGLGAVGTLVTVLVLALFVMVFGLVGGDSLWGSFRGSLPRRWRDQAQASGEAAMQTGRQWLGASAISGSVEGALIGLGLWLLDVPLAVPIAVLTFFAGFIPNIGAVLAGAVAMAVALFTGGMSTALWTLALVILVQQVQSNVLEPLFLSQAMQFHPLVTLLMTTAGGVAFGFVGMLLTVPVSGVVYSAVSAWRSDGTDDEREHDEG